MRDDITQAAAELRQFAAELRAGHTIGEEWPEPEVKAEYDRLRALASRLEARPATAVAAELVPTSMTTIKPTDPVEVTRAQANAYFAAMKVLSLEPHEYLPDAIRRVQANYDAAVKGRSDFRDALRKERSTPTPAVAVPECILEIGRRLIADARDNDHHTASPMFRVEKRRILTGIDTDYTDNFAWLDEDFEIIEGDEAASLEAAYDETGEVPDGYTRTGYMEQWEHVDTYLTPQAAEARINGGKDGRVNVDSAYRNSEMRAVRDFLMYLAATSPAATQESP